MFFIEVNVVKKNINITSFNNKMSTKGYALNTAENLRLPFLLTSVDIVDLNFKNIRALECCSFPPCHKYAFLLLAALCHYIKGLRALSVSEFP